MRREKEEEGGQKLLVFWGDTLVLLGVIKALFGVCAEAETENEVSVFESRVTLVWNGGMFNVRPHRAAGTELGLGT